MLVTLIACATALLSTFLVLSGLPMVLRDTATVLAQTLRGGPGRGAVIAYAGLWGLVFWLGLG